ncbi:XF1762 family protein [Nocardia nova]
MSQMQLCPVTFAEAADFVTLHHRHHPAPQGHKFSIGVAAGGELVGVAIIGRPVARHLDDGRTLEVTRTCTVGARNANSKLYAAAWNVAKNLGYTRLITYTQPGESGASLRGAGWRIVAVRRPHSGWNRPNRVRIDRATQQIERTLWEAAPAGGHR